MSQKNDTLPLIIAFLVTLGILGGGGWWFFTRSGVEVNISSNNGTTNNGTTPNGSGGNVVTNPFQPPATVPQGTTVKISGSTSMVQMNQGLKNRFELQYPGTAVITSASGSSQGIQDVIMGNADLAASSRPLEPSEAAQGLKAVPVATDAIAIVVSKDNPFSTGLTSEQVQGIFQGNIADWSAINPKNTGAIRVINRPVVSGTHETFRELVLRGGNFGSGANFTMMQQDATTPILQALGKDGISYATYSQIANQQTVRTVPINGVTPESELYPYLRQLYYVYKEPATPQVAAFLGFAGSPVGMEVIKSSL